MRIAMARKLMNNFSMQRNPERRKIKKSDEGDAMETFEDDFDDRKPPRRRSRQDPELFVETFNSLGKITCYVSLELC
jgi:hypothetical protein